MVTNDILQASLMLRLKSGLDSTINVSGTSMLPLLKDGYKVCIVSKTPQLGDIVVFRKAKLLIVHRVIDVKKDKYIIMGDNATVSDGEICKHDICGVATSFYDCSGKVHSFFDYGKYSCFSFKCSSFILKNCNRTFVKKNKNKKYSFPCLLHKLFLPARYLIYNIEKSVKQK